MTSDPFFPPNAMRWDLISRPGPAARLVNESGLFCGAKIHPDCLHIGADGSVRVSLSLPAEIWFRTICQLGEVLHLTRNPVAVLGMIAPLPELTDWSNPVLPRDAAGVLTPNLGQYASLWAVRESSPVGPAYGLEARDVSGQVFQKVVLTAPARRELFEQFVLRYQSPLAEAGNWASPNHIASRQRCGVMTQRMTYLRSRLQAGALQVRILPAAGLFRLLPAVAHTRLPIRTTHYNYALNQAAVWIPDVPEFSPGGNNAISFFHGDSVGLHLMSAAVAEAWLWQGRCHCCDKEHWTIEIGDYNDQVGLTITVGDDRLEKEWRDLVVATMS